MSNDPLAVGFQSQVRCWHANGVRCVVGGGAGTRECARARANCSIFRASQAFKAVMKGSAALQLAS